MSEPAVELRGVSFAYDLHPVLENVDLRIEVGSFTSIIGPNGGGKSTLLKLVLGLIAPDRGEVRVFGQSPRAGRRAIGYMPQYQSLDNSFPITAEEVVGLGRLHGGTWFGLPRRADREACERAFEITGCAHLRKLPFSSLSGGQRQLVLIARALVGEPRLLLLDEPTANLDPAVEESFYALLQRLRGGITIALVSHDVGLVAEQSEQVLCVNRKVEQHAAHTVSGDFVHAMFGAQAARVVDHSHDHTHRHPPREKGR
jgi:zinc transport system ATP-binding protein